MTLFVRGPGALPECCRRAARSPECVGEDNRMVCPDCGAEWRELSESAYVPYDAQDYAV